MDIGNISEWQKRGVIIGILLMGILAFGLVKPANAAQLEDFLITVKTDNPGTSSSTAFTIPTTGAGYNYNVDCDDDETIDLANQTTDATCVYPAAGTYTIAISGNFPRIFFNYAGDAEKILSVDQWGDEQWTSMAFAFAGARNMIVNTIRPPDLSLVTDMSGMFNEATSVNAGLSAWNTSNVTDMSGMFSGATSFNGDISNWDTSNVTNMFAMFVGTPFNQNISLWNTAQVTNTSYMFERAAAFNQDIGAWNMSQVSDMSRMFDGASAFNQNLGSWNVSNVTNATFFLRNSGILVDNYDQLLTGWSSQTLQPNVVFGAGSTEYCATAAHDVLTQGPNNWTMTDGGPSSTCSSVNPYVEFSTSTASSTDETVANNFPVLLVQGVFNSPTQVVLSIIGGTAVQGVDYSMQVTTTITIPTGTYDGTMATALALPVPTLIPNSIVDGNRTIIFRLSNASVANVNNPLVGDADGNGDVYEIHTYTITDDDGGAGCATNSTDCGGGSSGCSTNSANCGGGGSSGCSTNSANCGGGGSSGCATNSANCGGGTSCDQGSLNACGTAFPVATATQGPLPTVPASTPNPDVGGEVLGERISIIDELILKYDCYTYAEGIRQLQIELQKQGYFPADFVPTTYYGNKTRAAVAKYLNDQAASMSLDELVKFAFKLGQRNNAVKRLQTELKAAGFFPANVPATGYRGQITKAAIAKYKAAHR